MPDLRVNFGGLELKNPFMVASACTSKTVEQVKLAETVGAGSVILKATVTKHPYQCLPRYYSDYKKALYCPMDPRLLAAEGVELIKACKREVKIPVIANTMGSGPNIDSWVEIAKQLADAGADMVELNIACPNIGIMQKLKGELTGNEDEVLGAVVGQSPGLAGRITQAVRAAIKVPIMVKMTPEAADMPAVAEASILNGADAIDVSNAAVSLPGVNIFEGGKPLFKNLVTQSFSGLCGPAMKPLTLKNVAQVKLKCLNAEIAASGGIMDWKDTVEAIMVGARVVTYCTEIMWHGWDLFKKLNKQLPKYMAEQGYETIDDFYSCALKYITTPNKVTFRYVVPAVDDDKCNGCGICSRHGHCDAIVMEDGRPVVTKELCLGCATCADLCPTKAMTMVEDPKAYKGVFA
jgi:dihydroorotate dehydrogenase subfamily 1